MSSIYIAGPVTGRSNLNAPAFFAVEAALRGLAEKIYNPHVIGNDVRERCGKDACGQDYMDACIPCVINSDAICLLPDWEDSAGACVEAAIAKLYGLKFFMAIFHQSGEVKIEALEPPKTIYITKSYSPRPGR